MLEKRKQPRKKVTQPLAVHDLNRGSVLGQVVDISSSGLLLFSFEPMSAGTVLRLGLELPAEINCGALAEFSAESQWAEPSHEPPRYWVGFQIVDIVPDNAAKLQRLFDAV